MKYYYRLCVLFLVVSCSATSFGNSNDDLYYELNEIDAEKKQDVRTNSKVDDRTTGTENRGASSMLWNAAPYVTGAAIGISIGMFVFTYMRDKAVPNMVPRTATNVEILNAMRLAAYKHGFINEILEDEGLNALLTQLKKNDENKYRSIIAAATQILNQLK